MARIDARPEALVYGRRQMVLIVANGVGHMSMDDGWWIVMGSGMILFWGLVILGIVLAARELSSGRRSSDRGRREPGDDALMLLDRRLAEGEISPEEYRERKAVLRGD